MGINFLHFERFSYNNNEKKKRKQTKKITEPNTFVYLEEEVESKKYRTIGIVPNVNRFIVETEAKCIPLTLLYMTAYFSGLV